MTFAQVRLYSQALNRMESERLRVASIAVRAGMADDKSFKAWLKSLDQ